MTQHDTYQQRNVVSPDYNALGFLAEAPDPFRYENKSMDPDDAGMLVTSLVSQAGRVLDVGCGTGCVTETILSNTRASVVGIEPDEERCNLARSKGLNVFHGLLSAEFLTEHGPFDTIVFADVLEHLPNPGAMIQLARDGLSSKGTIVVSVPNIANWFVRVDILRGRFRYRDCGIMDATHLRWFTHDTLHEFFKNLGFEVTDHLYSVNSFMPEYVYARPWRWVPQRIRRQVVGLLVRKFPNLFGCQHVVRTRPISAQIDRRP
jgi:2-polyprenyl-3-methyl-5-hydroxy-6-metoxy-1,4-benzoquinol methylase